jgi:uncharacterized protein YyaL (SSP411 family)
LIRAFLHLNAAVDWVQRAHAAANNGGMSKGYDLLRRRWSPSYPETTGYTIPTLLNTADVLERETLRPIAFRLADYLLEHATEHGGITHWSGSTAPIVFDTGQVIFGWLAAYEASGDSRYLRAAERAGDWLVSVQSHSGAWNNFQHLDVVKVIDTRVAWALLALHGHMDKDEYRRSAALNLEWAVRQQERDGWFRHCAFTHREDPFTHTLAYTAEGLFEGGLLLGEPAFVRAARLTADALLARQRADGSLAATYAAGWRPTSRSSCLAGNCQMARLWLRFVEAGAAQTYYEAAQRSIAFVSRTQNLATSNRNIRGAIGGSHPIYGVYERLKCPNWAAKFFIDALLLLTVIDRRQPLLQYAG